MQRKALCPPYQEQSGITGNTIWKLENLRGKTKSMWLQIALPIVSRADLLRALAEHPDAQQSASPKGFLASAIDSLDAHFLATRHPKAATNDVMRSLPSTISCTGSA